MFKLKLARYHYHSLAEGPRPSTTLWVSGCSLHCPGCFNPELWSGEMGHSYTPWQIWQIVRKGARQGDRGVAFVGGEPLEQPWGLIAAIAVIRTLAPKTVISVYSGYTLEQLLQKPVQRAVLHLADFLVDGRFIQSQSHPQPNYRGSTNQRIIRLKESRRTRWRTLFVAHRDWDRLIAVSARTLSGPPTVMAAFGRHDQAQDCGHFSKAGDKY